MAQRKRRKVMAEINVVPYIDVTLVLLIIFMITAPMVQSGIGVKLPQAMGDAVTGDDLPSPIIITIAESGEYSIDLGDGEGEALATAEELLLLTAATRKNKANTPVYIRGDKRVAYGKVVVVMAALKNSGVENVGLMTEQQP